MTNSCVIHGCSVVKYRRNLARPLGNARSSWTIREGVLIQLVDQHGHVGEGEAAPLPAYSLDELADSRRHLEAFAARLRAQSVSLDLSAPLKPQMLACMDSIPLEQPAARFALETAMLDLISQHRQSSFHETLAFAADLRTPMLETVRVSKLLEGLHLEDNLSQADEALSRGVSTLKLKIGRPGKWAEELRLLNCLRSHLPSHVRYRLDANGMLNPHTARAQLEEVIGGDAYSGDIESVEEPMSAEALLQCDPLPLPILLDESLQRALPYGLLERLFLTHRVRGLVLKPTTLGGSLACLELADRAHRLGGWSIVTHTLEGPVAFAACLALARLLPESRPCGLDAHVGIEAFGVGGA